ncbi:MAG: RNA polymerase sigma factor [Parvibaculaceae bacterium]|nr:RNA polymerase sigma factor [Parvibaculaceae bacterium]
MANSNRLSLRQILVEGYYDMRRRLTRRLGSVELASEVLHEAWLRLDDARDAALLLRPNDYIFRVALNIASDRRRTDNRRLSYSEVESLYHFADTVLHADREIEARSEVAALGRAFEGLTQRQQAILIAVRVEGTPHAELARRFGISERMIDKDLRRALEHCANQLERTLNTRFSSHPFKSSTE